MTKQLFPVTDPSMMDMLKVFKQEIFASLNCVKIGAIESFDATKKTASIRLSAKKVLPDNTVREHPLLTDVPVFTLSGGTGGIQFPIAKGDQCVVLFSDRNIDAWFEAGGVAAPYDARCHDLSDGIALVGLTPLSSTMAANPASAVKLFHGTASYTIKSNKHVIKNGTTDLLAVINAFFVALEAIKTTTNLTLHADSITALETAKAQFATLLGVPS